MSTLNCKPQAAATTLATRLAKSQNSLFRNVATSRAAKRNASKINYSEDYAELEFQEDDAGAHEDEGDLNYEDYGNVGLDIYRGIINNNHMNYQTAGAKMAPQQFNELLTPFTNSTLPKKPEAIVPIKLNVTHNGLVLRDSILWNMNDELLTAETFASLMVEDLDLTKSVETAIVGQINDQLDQYEELFSHPNNQIIDQFLQNEGEFHAVLELSVYIGEDFFTDRVEWNFTDDLYTPEIFAKGIVQDMSLRREFETAIAFSVYEEIYKIKRELVDNPQQITQYIDTLPFFNLVNQSMKVDDASQLSVQGIRYDKKKHGEEFSPSLERLSEWEIEKRETEKERNLRRRKRETMRVR